MGYKRIFLVYIHFSKLIVSGSEIISVHLCYNSHYIYFSMVCYCSMYNSQPFFDSPCQSEIDNVLVIGPVNQYTHSFIHFVCYSMYISQPIDSSSISRRLLINICSLYNIIIITLALIILHYYIFITRFSCTHGQPNHILHCTDDQLPC